MGRIVTTLALALLAGLPTLAHAGKHYITGVVTDRNGEPVDRAIVSLSPGNVQLVTDREGNFIIDYLRDDEGDQIRLGKKTDYQLEVFKPGYHTVVHNFYYFKGIEELETFTLIEETIEVEDQGENLDPELYGDPSKNTGATYEGQ